MANTMRLQGVGMVEGTEAREIKVGDFLMWNFGGMCEVMSVNHKSAKTVEIVERYEGKDYDRTMRSGRMVHIVRDARLLDLHKKIEQKRSGR